MNEHATEAVGRPAAEEVEMAEAESWRLHDSAVCDSWFSSCSYSAHTYLLRARNLTRGRKK